MDIPIGLFLNPLVDKFGFPDLETAFIPIFSQN